MNNNQFNNQQNGQERALDKFARNLNELASQGKLDPVIGRDEEPSTHNDVAVIIGGDGIVVHVLKT